MYETIEIDGVNHEIRSDRYDTLLESGALRKTDIGVTLLNEDHAFTIDEVRMLLAAD